MLLFEFIRFVAWLLIAGVVLRILQAKMADNPIGEALAFIY